MPKKDSPKRRPLSKRAKNVPSDPWEPRALIASIVDSSDDAIISKDLNGIITSWNRGAERLYGYKSREVVGQSISILVPPDRPKEIPDILEKIARGEPVDHYQSVRITKSGQRLDVFITVSPLRNAKGRVVGASAIARDITVIEQARRALQESESRAHALFQAAAQAIFIVDQNGRIAMVNPATRSMFGYSEDELIGKPVEMLLPAAFRSGHKTHRDGFFRDPQMRPMGLGLDLQACRKDGTEFFVEISLSYIRTAQDTLAVAFVTDISRRRADEEAIRQQREDLRSLAARLMTAQDDERRRIARDLHDDLSQRLAFLAMDLGRLAMKAGEESATAQIRSLQKRAMETSESVRRISHQLHPSVLDDIGLEAALEQYCEEFEQRSGISTSFRSRNVPDSLRTEIASSIYHIAQECLRNVSKHSQTETVSVALEFVDGMLRLTVKDQGIGLQNESNRKGIGFVAMKERAHLVNGKVSILSKVGSGTMVSVEIPASHN